MSHMNKGSSVTQGDRSRGLLRTGVDGLDDVLCGGLTPGRMYLLEGSPGTGKTTLAFQFLMAGAAAGELGLYLSLAETKEELGAVADSHGWRTEGVEIVELLPAESLLDQSQQQSLLYSADLELGETVRQTAAAFESSNPKRVVIDSLSELRLLAQSSLRYRRQLLELKHFFAQRDATVLMLDDLTSEPGDKTTHSIAHGVISLEALVREYGPERHRFRVIKYRGISFRGGFHDYKIQTGGLRVYPRLLASAHGSSFVREALPTNNAGLDALLGGGVDRGSSTLILGPSGTGKSLLALSFITAAVARGERAAMLVFDEELGLLLDRAMKVGVDLRTMIQSGALAIQQVDAAELSPGEFTTRVRSCVEDLGARTIVIDSLNGYHASMPEENSLLLHIHEVLQYLNRMGVASFVTVAQQGLVGNMETPVDVTYLADTVILLRYFEVTGRVSRAISVFKKRTGVHEDTIREYRISCHGITLGEPLTSFQGVLSGVPEIVIDDASRRMPKAG